MRPFHAHIVIGITLALFGTSAQAKGEDQSKEGDLQSIMLTQCAAMNAQFRATPGISDVLKTRPEPAMCECVSRGMSADAALESLRGASEEEIQKRVANKNFETFFVAKLSAIFFSCLSCLSQELDAGVKSFPID
jgi:hypothetical protein